MLKLNLMERLYIFATNQFIKIMTIINVIL